VSGYARPGCSAQNDQDVSAFPLRLRPATSTDCRRLASGEHLPDGARGLRLEVACHWMDEVDEVLLATPMAS
jgi:hypothetical protein